MSTILKTISVIKKNVFWSTLQWLLMMVWLTMNRHWWKYITVTSSWARWLLKSPAFRLFAQTFVQTKTEENIKAPRHWPLWGESNGFPSHRPVTRKIFPFEDVIMIFMRYTVCRYILWYSMGLLDVSYFCNEPHNNSIRGRWEPW